MDALKVFTVLNKALMAHLALDSKLYRMFNENFFDELNVWPVQDGLVDSMLQLSTGEESMVDFNEAFDSPGGSHGKKPIAWDKTVSPAYIPDYIEGLIRNKELSAKDKFTKIQAAYKKCVKAKQRFEQDASDDTTDSL